MEFAQNSILILIFLLPGLFFFRGINSVSYSYVSQSLISWKTPSVISITFFISIIMHGASLVIFSAILLSTGNSIDIIFSKHSSLMAQWLSLYAVFISWLSNIFGTISIKNELIKKKSILQLFKHQWVWLLIKGILFSKSRNEGRLFKASVLTTEEVKTENYLAKRIYQGEVVDFFLSSDGKFEYIALKNTEKSDSFLIDVEKRIQPNKYGKVLSKEHIKKLEDFNKNNNNKSTWIPVKSDLDKKNIFYMEGDIILNILIIPEQTNSGDIKFTIWEHIKIKKEILLIFSLFLGLTIFNSIFSVSEKKPSKSKTFDINIVSTFEGVGNVAKDGKFVEGDFLTGGTYINVRSSPSKFAKIITNLKAVGENIQVKKEVPENLNWYEVTLPDGTIGYIFSDLLSEKSK